MEFKSNYNKKLIKKYEDIIKNYYIFNNISMSDIKIKHIIEISDDLINNIVFITNSTSSHIKTSDSTNNVLYKLDKDLYIDLSIKRSFYLMFNKKYKIYTEWGIAINENGVELANNLINLGLPTYLLKETLVSQYLISNTNADIISKIIKSNSRLICNNNLLNIEINLSNNLTMNEEKERYYNNILLEI